MANQSTKWFRKNNLVSKVVKGTSRATAIEYVIFKGSLCLTSFKDREKNPQNKRSSAWRGAKNISSNYDLD